MSEDISGRCIIYSARFKLIVLYGVFVCFVFFPFLLVQKI